MRALPPGLPGPSRPLVTDSRAVPCRSKTDGAVAANMMTPPPARRMKMARRASAEMEEDRGGLTLLLEATEQTSPFKDESSSPEARGVAAEKVRPFPFEGP
jgi:hypothetical protein